MKGELHDLPMATDEVVHEVNESATRHLPKLILLLVVIVAVTALVHLSGIERLRLWLESLSAYMATMGWAGPLVFVLLTALLTAIGFPRLLLCVMGGATFGFAAGLPLGLAGSLLGSYAAFAVARMTGREFILQRWPKLARFAGRVRDRGILSVLLIRQIPLTSFQISVLLGMTRVRHRQFLIGSALGFLPEAVPATLVGAGAVQADLATLIQYGLLAVVLLVGLGFALHWLMTSARSPLARDTAISQ